MEIQEFVKNFGEQFDDTDIAVFTPETNFKDLDEWSSMVALSIIAMVDEQYGKKLSGTEIRSVSTIKELQALLETK